MRQTTEEDQGKGKKRLLRPCKWCGSRTHYQTFCHRRPRQPVKTRVLPKKLGRQGKKTAQAVAKWKKTQKANHRGMYVCYMCEKEIPYLMAEHVKSKARHPELRTDPNNLKPCCAECNAQKGSKDN